MKMQDLSACHLSQVHIATYSQRFVICLKESGLNDVVVFGGGIIPESDRPPLYSAGVRAIFGPGTPSTEILEFVEEASTRDCGVGSDNGWIWGE